MPSLLILPAGVTSPLALPQLLSPQHAIPVAVSYLVICLPSSQGVSHRRQIWELPAPIDVGDDKAHLREKNCQRGYLAVEVVEGNGSGVQRL